MIISGIVASQNQAAHGAPYVPSWSNVKLLMSCNDSGLTNVKTGNATSGGSGCYYSTAQAKWGSGSAYCNEWYTYRTPHINDLAALKLANTDFTYEMWVRREKADDQCIYITRMPYNGSYSQVAIWFLADGSIICCTSLTGAAWGLTLTSTTKLTLDTWWHFAFVRAGDTYSLYMGTSGTGNREATGTQSGALYENSDWSPQFFHYDPGSGDSSSFKGWVDDIRISAQAVYSGATYTVPTGAFPTS